MNKMGRYLVLGALVAIFFVMITGWGWDTFDNIWEDGLVVAISTAVAIIPESLVPVVTLTLTLGISFLGNKLIFRCSSFSQTECDHSEIKCARILWEHH